MTDYSFQSYQVDVKADNSHASARVVDTATTDDDLAGGKTAIYVGSFVVSVGTVGRIDMGAAGVATAVGIATQTRVCGDSRPLTYTRRGMVWAIKDATAINQGDRLILGAQGMVTPGSDIGADTNKELGVALESSSGAVGTKILMEVQL